MENEVLLFAYFKGHGDGLHLAASTDGYRWEALNHDSLFLAPQIGVEKILRDPCLVYGADDLFHLVWTTGWTEHGIGYASSKDLLTWSPQFYIPVMAHEAKARNCWAPEIFFDERSGEYMIYWSSTIEGKFPETQPYGDDGYNHRIYYCTTTDFKSFSETRLLYDGGFNAIDAHITEDIEENRFLLFIKDETLVPPKKHIRFAVGNSPTDFGTASSPITPSQYWAEGPTAVRLRDHWLVYFDKYKINQIGAVRSTDLCAWEDVSHELDFPKGAQHGSVLKVTADVIQHLYSPMARDFKSID